MSGNTDGVELRVLKQKLSIHKPSREENMEISFLINLSWTLSIIISTKINRKVHQVTSTVA